MKVEMKQSRKKLKKYIKKLVMINARVVFLMVVIKVNERLMLYKVTMAKVPINTMIYG